MQFPSSALCLPAIYSMCRQFTKKGAGPESNLAVKTDHQYDSDTDERMTHLCQAVVSDTASVMVRDTTTRDSFKLVDRPPCPTEVVATADKRDLPP